MSGIAGLPAGFVIPSLDGLDFSRHDTLIHTILSLNITIIVAVVLTVTLRIYARLSISGHVGYDDWLMIFAAVFALSLSTVCILGTNYGLGKHVWDLDLLTILAQLQDLIKVLLVCLVMYTTAISIAKLSIVASYLRIFPNKRFAYVCYGLAVVLVVNWLVTIFITIFQCKPVAAAWDFTIAGRQCYSMQSFYLGVGTVTAVTDAFLCVMPLPLLWNLQMRRKTKIGAFIIFGVGFFACAASSMRLSQLHNLSNTAVDITYLSISPLNWSVIEVYVSIFCACVPAIRSIILAITTRLKLGSLVTMTYQTARETLSRTKNEDKVDIEMKGSMEDLVARHGDKSIVKVTVISIDRAVNMNHHKELPSVPRPGMAGSGRARKETFLDV